LEIVFLLIFGLVVGVALWLIFRYAPRRKLPLNLSGCGKCGYPAKGLSTFQCPECGSDLRVVGIIPPGMNRRGRRFGLVVFWTIFLLVVAVVATDWLNDNILPAGGRSYIKQSLEQPKSNEYLSGLFEQWWIEYDKPSYMGKPTADVKVVMIDLFPRSGPMTHIRVDFRANKDQVIDGTSAITPYHQPLDGQGILAWMASVGIDTARTEAKTESQTIMQHVQAASMGALDTLGYAGFSGMSASHRSRSPICTWFDGLLFVFWLAVWIIGVRWIVRRQSDIP
jgi:hypothetical protein